jgi:hypothetical protein
MLKTMPVRIDLDTIKKLKNYIWLEISWVKLKNYDDVINYLVYFYDNNIKK